MKNPYGLTTRTWHAMINGVYDIAGKEVFAGAYEDRTKEEKKRWKDLVKKYLTLQWFAENFHSNDVYSIRGLGEKSRNELRQILEKEGFEIGTVSGEEFPKFYTK